MQEHVEVLILCHWMQVVYGYQSWPTFSMNRTPLSPFIKPSKSLLDAAKREKIKLWSSELSLQSNGAIKEGHGGLRGQLDGLGEIGPGIFEEAERDADAAAVGPNAGTLRLFLN